MSIVTEEPLAQRDGGAVLGDLSVLDGADDLGNDASPSPDEEGAASDEVRALPPAVVTAAGVVAAFGAAWPMARLFEQTALAVALATIGIAIGAGCTYVANRGRGSRLAGVLPIPLAVVVGAMVVAPDAGSGTANLLGLIHEAVSSAGLEQAPIPLDPGWRFIVIVLFAVLVAGSVSLAIGSGRPRLAVVLVLPVLAGAGLLQPEGSEVLSGAVAMAFVIGGLAVAYGADLAADGATGGAFELRRLGRGAGMLVLLLAALVLAAQSELLFPATDQDQVIPPRKPPASPPEEDRELFTVESDQAGPWRVGVLDVYGQDALLLPPVDPSRIVEVEHGRIADAAGRETFTATFSISDVRGHTLPVPAGVVQVEANGDLEYDPRIGTVTLGERIPQGFRYTVTAVAPPDGKAMGASPSPDPVEFAEFLALPEPPSGVRALLAKAPDDNAFERLQFVRQTLFDNVIAAGAGQPVDILPERVGELLAGAEATPYEISAAEVMLARWAGIPARLGYGYHGGDKVDGGLSFRPEHGAAWLEAYFENSGWVPILGTPPRAKPSLSDEQKNEDDRVQAIDTLALTVFVPVKFEGLGLLYQIVRYWTVVATGAGLALAGTIISIPYLFKRVRASRRRRWAQRAGLPQRLLVAYAEFRDRMYDLNVGDPRDTPLEFLDAVDTDVEHTELAWVVTRGLWGDLVRDLRESDVEIAEEMARSVTRRVVVEQSGLNRIIGAVTRASLRSPWSLEIPNLWRRPRARARRLPRPRLRLRLRPRTASLLVPFLLVGCATPSTPPATTIADYPERDVPSQVLGYEVKRQRTAEKEYDAVDSDASLVKEGRVYTIQDGETVQGSYQVAVLKPEYRAQDLSLQADFERSLASRAFTTTRLGLIRLRVSRLVDQDVYVWFPPDRNAMQIFVMRKEFNHADDVVREVIWSQLGFEEGV